MEEVSEKSQRIGRVTFSALFLVLLSVFMFEKDSENVLPEGVCIQDKSFQLTKEYNNFLRDNTDIKKRYIIFASTLMDFMLVSFVVYYFFRYWKSYRIIIAYIIFFSTRALLQRVFFMTRLDGFIFEHPGVHSITIPYHDTNDFFYSGHVGTCFLLFREYRSAKYFKLSYYCLFTLVNQWMLMCLIRTHYVIDMITGVLMAHYIYILAEKISFFFDVLVLGIPDHKRMRKYLKPCERCGWGNDCCLDYMPHNERQEAIEALKYSNQMRTLLNMNNMKSYVIVKEKGKNVRSFQSINYDSSINNESLLSCGQD